jgi:hypothetical protein
MAARKSGGRSKGAGSLLSQAWRSDPDLKSPQHDRMSFAMTNREFMHKLIVGSEAFTEGSWRREPRHDQGQGGYCGSAGEEQQSGKLTVHRVQLEVPVLRKWHSGSSTVGFWDAVASTAVEETRRSLRCSGPRSEHQSLASDWSVEMRDREFHIEAKTTMLNPMEVLRQVKFYQAEHGSRLNIIIWCPGMDKLYADAFRAEGIWTWDGAAP